MDDTTDDEQGAPRNEDKHGKMVNLTRIKSAYSEKAHNESNLPNVLDEYGLEKKESKHHNREKTEKKKHKKSGNRYAVDDESKEKRRKKREERYAQMMEEQQNMPEGSQYYSKKVSGMMTRLANPEEQLSLRKDIQPDAKSERHVFVKRMDKHVLTSNNSFLRDLPKSELAKVIELQDRLVREGKLKTQADIDNFREDIKKPEVFDSYFKKPAKQPDTGSQTSVQTDSKASRSLPKPADMPPRSLSHISESSRPVTREDWAITHQFPNRNDEVKQIPSKKLDFEKRFPKPVMPPLKCFTMELGDKPPDPEELQKQAELRVRVKQRKKFLRKLQRMHQMAMAHGAAASRIMEKHGEISNILEGTTLRDVISVLPKPEDQYISEDELLVAEPGQQLALEDRLASRGSTRSTLSSHSSGMRSLHSRDSRKLDSRESKKRARKPIKWKETNLPSNPAPLTMDEIREKTKVLEAKCLSTNWINYMKAGKQSQQAVTAT